MRVSNWREVRLGDLVTFQRGHDLPRKEMKDGPYPVVGSNGIIGYHSEYTTDAPCITIGRSGNVGNPFLLKCKTWAHNTTLYVKEFKNTDPIFIYYLLKTLDLGHYAGGSAVPTLNRNHIHPILVSAPESIKEQHSIAVTLSVLDDMIELNNQINKTLEEMAQAIFKSWFVDFEPFKDGEFEESELGMIPKGWNVKRIDQIDIEITDYVANGSFAALKENVTLCDEEDYAVFIRNVDLKANSFNKFVDKKSYEFLRKTKLWGGEVIISNVGDVGSVFRCPLLAKPMTLGNNMIMLKSISPVNYNLFLYILFKYSYGIELIKSITSGSAQPKFNKTDFRNLKIIVPPKEVIQLFNNIVEKLYRIVDEGIVENQLLSTVRDTLLPKLMSGEIRVPVEGAM